MFSHVGELVSGSARVCDVAELKIDRMRRAKIRANHSATHLLHKALRETLGDHVTQKGSLVAADRLRFDISHNKPVSREEIAAVERKVNEVVWRATPVDTKVMTPDDAINAGAMALFGEKYGDKVRVLSMGEDAGKTYSVELCGGTHVRNTGDIGAFKITSEGSVASGVRRLEAVTGKAVQRHLIDVLSQQAEEIKDFQQANKELVDALVQLQKPAKPAAEYSFSVDTIKSADLKAINTLFDAENIKQAEALAVLQDANKKLGKELAEAKKQAALGDNKVEKEIVNGIVFVAKAYNGLDPKELRAVAESFLKQAENGIAAVGTNVEGKASVVVAVSKELSQKHSAVTLVQAAVAELGGKGGGGKPDMAQGGGPDGDKLEAAIAKIRAVIQ